MTMHNKTKIALSVCGLLLGLLTSASHASTQEDQIPLPEVRVVDPLGVNMQTFQVTASQPTVSIGGERGLSHSISLQTNHFTTTGGWYGYLDKYAGKAKYVVFAEYPGVTGFSGTDCAPIQNNQVWLMRLSGPEGSEDFKVLINGTFDCNVTGTVTSGYSYQALGDVRNTLEAISGSYDLRWTRPDGTELYYEQGSSPHATAEGRLRQIVYPNGYTVSIEFGNVTSNTGFHLKYEFDSTNVQYMTSGEQALYNSNMLIPSESPGQFALANPKHVRAVNRAVEYCAPGAASCSSTWPAATFTWPGGMPRALYLDAADDVDYLAVEDANGSTVEYHFKPHDVMKMQDGTYADWPYDPGEVWSPRMVGIKHAGSGLFQREYDYRTRFVLNGNGGQNYWELVSEEGEVMNARGPEENDSSGVGYSRSPLPSGADALQSDWHQGVYRMEPATTLPGRMSLVTAPLNGQYFYESNYWNRITQFVPVDSAEPDKHYEYDSRGNLIQVTMRQGQADQTEITAGYPASCTASNRKFCNKPEWIIDARGNQTDYTYHADSGQVATVTGPADDNGIRPVTRYEYDDLNAWYYQNNGTTLEAGTPVWLLTETATCRTTATNTSGTGCTGGSLDEVVTVYDYGPQDGSAPNNLWPIGVSVTAEVDGVLQTRTTCFEYDIYGHRIGETQPKGVSGSCPAFDPQQTQLPAPYKLARRYTPGGQLTGEINPDPDGDNQDFPAVRHTYNSRGLLINTEHGVLTVWQSQNVAPANWTGFTVSHQELFSYDDYGRKISQARADASGTLETLSQQSFDVYNRPDCSTVRLNPAQAPSNPCTLGPEGQHGPDRITRFEYDSQDNLLREKRAVGTDLEQVHVEYTYNAENRVETVTDANDNTAKFEYDNYGRKIKWCFPSKARGSGTINCSDYESYAYDENGNRTQLRKRDTKIINYEYDALNRLVYKNLPNTTSGDVYYRYELTGAQLHARFGSHTGQGVITNYSGFGEPEIDTVTVGGVTRTIERTFDINGNRTRITHPDNPFFDYIYDDLNRLDSIEDTSGNLLIADSYDQFARPETRVTAGNAITALTYDPVSRLKSIGFQFSGVTHDLTIEFGYNPAGQLSRQNLSNNIYHHTGSVGKTGGYVVNGLNQYDSINGVTYTYDANGNLTDDGPNTYTYDVENRLISVSGTDNATLSYDPMGRLYRYTANGTMTDFVYDGDSLIVEYQSGSITKRYVHGISVDTPLVQYTGSSVGTTNRQFLHRNHQGSVIAASDNGGVIDYINTYDAYGVPATSNQGRFGYTGQMYLAELGLYHYRARVYNPHIGRFMQTDPVGYEDQMNLYAYVHNDPMTNIDPMGTTCYRMTNGIGAVCAGQGLIDSMKSAQSRNDNSSGNSQNSSQSSTYEGQCGVNMSCIGDNQGGQQEVFNWLKFSVGAVNTVFGVKTTAGGVARRNLLTIGLGLSGVSRGVGQMKESVNTREGPNPKNLWGLFPFGQKFDDPLEPPGPINYGYDMRDKFILDPIKAGFEVVKDFFAID